jgi:lipoprotein-anchoring transpeptidase ErfK/SrfK
MRRLLAPLVVLSVPVAALAACGYEDPVLQESQVSTPATTEAVASGPESSSTTSPPVTSAPDEPATIVAQARSDLSQIEVFAEPGASRPTRTVENPGEYGNEQVFLVEERRDGWARVELPVRPNDSRGWIRESDVELTGHDYRFEVQLANHRIRLWNGEQQLLDEPIGVGTSDTPTPGGTYFTWVLIDPTTSAYGAYAYGLSGFSEKLQSFAGGDARLGIHGTPDASSIGRDVSHGCIRLNDEVMIRLVEQVKLPLGVPVTVLA